MAAASGGAPPPIHSVRLPGLVARQEVILGDLAQTLRSATTRSAASPSCPACCSRFARGRRSSSPLVIGLENVLF